MTTYQGCACGCHLAHTEKGERCELCFKPDDIHDGLGWKIVRCPVHARLHAAQQRMQAARLEPNCDMCGKPRDKNRYCPAGCDDD